MLLLVAPVAHARQAVPADWKTVTDARKDCRVTVPPDWTSESGTSYSPDRRVSAALNSVNAGSWEIVKASLKLASPPVKMVEDDGRALIYSVTPSGADTGKVGWNVAINSVPVCTASFVYAPGTDEEPLKKIAASLSVAK